MQVSNVCPYVPSRCDRSGSGFVGAALGSPGSFAGEIPLSHRAGDRALGTGWGGGHPGPAPLSEAVRADGAKLCNGEQVQRHGRHWRVRGGAHGTGRLHLAGHRKYLRHAALPLGNLPCDQAAAFRPVTVTTVSRVLLAIGEKSLFKGLASLIAAAKKEPEKLTHGTGARAGSAPHARRPPQRPAPPSGQAVRTDRASAPGQLPCSDDGGPGSRLAASPLGP